MRGKHKKLKQWVEAGLLSESQADAIQTYENDHKAGRFGRGLIGLSVFAILVGVLSIIASNWYLLGAAAKIGSHVLLNIGIGYGAYQAMKKGKNIWREGFTLGLFGLTLTLIALIGQVYQLGGEPAIAFMTWMVITLPFMLLFANSYMTVIPWTLAFITTLCFALFHFGEDWTSYWQGVVATALYLLLPLTFMAKGTSRVLKKWKPVWSEVFLGTGIVLTTIVATISIIVMGFDRVSTLTPEETQKIWAALDTQRLLCFIGFSGIFVHSAFNNWYRNDERLKLGATFAALSLAIMALPMFFLTFFNLIIAAIMFIAYWGYIGWLGQQLGQMRLISLAITLIAIRIFVVYLEVFGTLMSTGFGLIIGGGVMLGLIWGARKMNKRLTTKAGA